jgi:flagellar biosynthetic protein FliR
VIDVTPLARFALLLVRPGMLVVVAPGIGGMQLPAMTRIGLVVLVAIGVLPAVDVPAPRGEVELAVWIAREAAIGLSLGFAIRALVAAAEFAGQMSSYQIGFSYGAIVDPQSGVRNHLLAVFYGLLAIMAFLGVNGHHALLRGLAASYAALPIGSGGIEGSLVGTVASLLGLVFTVAVRLAAPIVLALLVVEAAIGIVSRAAPALNALVVGYPVRIVVGLLVLAFVVSAIPSVIASLVERALVLGASTAGAFR